VSVKRTNLSHSRQWFNTLITRSLAVAGGRSSLHCAGLVTPERTRGDIDPLHHSRHNDGDKLYECDREIKALHLGYLIASAIFRFYWYTVTYMSVYLKTV